MEEYLVDFNSISKRPMNLAMFLFAVEHVSRICRLLKQPGGHMLLVGVGGSGRQSLSRLAAHICGMDLFQSYTRVDWREDLKKILKKAGGEAKATVFLFSDTQIKDEGFVEDINNILNSGEVPNMFPMDERMTIMEMSIHLKITEASEEFLQELGRFNYVTPTSYLELISAFKTLLDSKRSENTKMKSRYIIGLEKLKGSAEQVELKALQPQLVKTVGEVGVLMESIAKEKKEVVEPKAAIVNTEQAKAQEKADAAKAIKDECEADLAEAVPIMNEALAALDTIKEADITYIKKLGNPPGAIKLVLEAVCVILDAKPAKIKDESGKMVPDYWKPSVALMAEKDFLKNLKTYDKDNIPPKLIAAIRTSYLTNENFTPDNAKKASPAAEGMCKWVHAMSSYDKVAKVVAPKKAKLKEADEEYQEVMVGLRAKQAELQELLDKLAAMEDDLKKNTQKKNRLEDEVQLCSVKLERAEKLIGGLGGEKVRWTETAEGLAKAYTNLTGDMLISAGIIAYSGAFTASYRTKIIESFVSMCRAGRVPHTTKFSLSAILGEPVQIRDWLIASLPNDSTSIENGIVVANSRRWPLCIDPQGQANKWIKNLEKAANLQVIKLSESGEYLRTLENAIQFGLPVLLENVGEELDPSLEPLLLKQIFKQGGVNCIRLGDSTIEYSAGFRFYITTKLRNPHYLPEIAVKVTLLNFMITPAGLSDQMLGVVVATERPDLEEQKALLVVQSADNNRKLKEIEDKILEVLSNSEGNILEDETAIQIITEAKILGNDIAEKQKAAEVTELEIDNARVGYKPCGDYTSILFFCISDLANIDPMYQYSLPWFSNLFVASVHASWLTASCLTSFLLFMDTEPMYQYSLPWSSNLFVASVQAAAPSDNLSKRIESIYDHFTSSLPCNVCRSAATPSDNLSKRLENIYDHFTSSLPCNVCRSAATPSDNLSKRLENIYDHFTYSLYCNVCRSLFEKDKLLFAFLLCSRILESKGQIDSEEWMFLLTGGLGTTPDKTNPASDWLVDRGWKEMLRLDNIPAFSGLVDTFERHPGAWREMYESNEPHKVTLPGVYNIMEPFRKLLIVRIFRPDKVVPAVQDFVEANLGRKYVEPPPFNLHLCYGDSTPTTPLIFVLSAGSDPTAALLQFAGEKEMASRLVAVSLGQGQGPKAAALIAEGSKSGLWVVLQNCHLAPSWMSSLDKICEDLKPEETNADFRLWMTSYPSPKFPVNILQNGLEPVCDDEGFFETCEKPGPFKKLLFGLIYFHALIQERRKFGPLGWNIAYGFDDGDQRISVRQLHMFLNENETIPFDALRYVTGECNYGGRVTDDKDRLLLNTALEKCYCSDIVNNVDYKFSASGLYFAPPEGDRESCMKYIEGLPIIPMPEAFGLHANADISKDQNDTASMLACLLGMGGGGGGGGGAAGALEERVAAVVAECLERLPPVFDIESVQRKWPVLYEESMNTVLAQEMSRFNRLLAVMADSLKNMDLAMKGLLVMSAELEAAYRSMSVSQVPDLWKKVSYPSLKPLGSYLEDLYKRLKMLQDWYEEGIPKIFWLSGFFFVQSFLTAGLQNYARKNKLPIDMVGYDFEMLDVDVEQYEKNPPAEGVAVHGMYIEGCGWDSVNKKLKDSDPKVLFVAAPCMWLRPMPTDQYKTYQHYNCPVYRTAERKGVLATTGHSTNFVMFAKIPTDEPPSKWIMRGVAMLSQLSY
eukprot:gene12762-16013_t